MPPVDEGATRSATSRSLLGEDVPQSLREAAAETLPAEVPLRGEPLRAGRVVAGRYRLVEPIGAGAHGEVWAADDLVVGEPVAIKWMAAGSGALRARIRREVTTLRILRIPGVVRLIDDGVEGGHPYLVMDRVLGAPFPGGSAGRCAWADLAAPAIALLDVLGRVHAAGIVHRDLKPDNVLVSADGRPTLLDFGISRGSDPGARLTEGGRIVGTPLYLAPEQIVDGALDGRTDLYAVGVMLYAALTGRVPHEASSVDALLRARLMDRPAPVADLASDAPPEV
ncbi:MAG: serine/threonine protein kinase, partial [Polyangiaceae bacterium]|nr:serine/threonine protein kinase [Polyangiaceae bacterium]